VTGDAAQFEIAVTLDDCQRFAQLSGDWNPLHTDPAHAVASVYGRQVLHGAFSAGLISRLAGMYLPGKDCLLYGLKLRFVAPILPPAKLTVRGRIVSLLNDVGLVEATVSNSASGELHATATYEFGYHRMAFPVDRGSERPIAGSPGAPVVLITGSSGGLGSALLRRLGENGQSITRNESTGRIEASVIAEALGTRKISAIVHCAWPAPDNRRFIDLENPELAIDEHISGPLRDVQLLANLIVQHGDGSAPLVLIGSTFAKPGRHYFRMPLYSLAKSVIPTLVDLLAIELASNSRRCIGVIFDMLDGGMNKGISAATRQANADRSPWGQLGSTDAAAEQLMWLLENQSKLINGAIVTLSGGAIP
jgi:3-hydroxybutyryl-CoA dehydratase